MSEAIFGLIGVVVGGVLTGLVTAWLDGRHEASEGEVARRIAREEIERAEEAITEARKGHWPPGWHPTWSQSWAALPPAARGDRVGRRVRRPGQGIWGDAAVGERVGQRPPADQ